VIILKIKIKKDKWIVSFDVVVLECDIEKVGDIFIVVFLLENKKIRLKTQYLDETFKILEKIFNRRNQYQYR
jgi:hypothetical protein